MANNKVSYPPVGASTTAATQAEMESASSTTVMSTPGRQHYHPGHCKAWVSIDGTGTIGILASYNVASLTDNGVGDYTVTFTTAFSGTNYSMSGQRVINNTYAFVGYHTSGTTKTTTACRVACSDTGSLGDSAMCDVAFYGDQ